jgi:diadenosine tetraphosphate (Ap4A) HIT family hydrolase
MDDCPFCQIAAGNSDTELVAESAHSVAFYDRYPVSEGHALVIARRHEADLFDVDPEERTDAWALLDTVRELLLERFNPDGFNIGVNTNEAAGQTVGHAHIHLIPRYLGDVEDPRGGIRWVIPGKAPYWD